MNCDLFEGQKTGFFLDQRHNIRLVSELVVRKFTQGEEIRILDLCCYVGQWGTQLGNALKEKGKKVRLTSFDASKSALEFAAINAKRVGIEAEQICGDVLKDLDQIADRSFDVVIADPPAFIKKKNDIPTGKHAYLKMNTSAFRICRSGGFVVSCSCSGLLEREDFAEAIRKAIARNSVTAQNVLSGGHAEDHPVVLTFPEGHYLKMMCHYRRS